MRSSACAAALVLLLGCDLPPCSQAPGTEAVEQLVGTSLTSVEAYEGYCLYNDARGQVVATSSEVLAESCESHACDASSESVGGACVRSYTIPAGPQTEVAALHRANGRCSWVSVTFSGPRASLPDRAIAGYARSVAAM